MLPAVIAVAFSLASAPPVAVTPPGTTGAPGNTMIGTSITVPVKLVPCSWDATKDCLDIGDVGAKGITSLQNVVAVPTQNVNAVAPVVVNGIRAACTPDSMSVALAGALTAREMGRWQCMFQVLGTQPQKLSVAGFYIDFLELHHVDPPDVGDVFNQKQKMTKSAKVARVFEIIGVVALLTAGQTFLKLDPATTAKVAEAAGLTAYGAGKLGDYYNKQVPPTTNAIYNILTEDITLQPGESRIYKVYASLVHGAHSIGPRMLSK